MRRTGASDGNGRAPTWDYPPAPSSARLILPAAYIILAACAAGEALAVIALFQLHASTITQAIVLASVLTLLLVVVTGPLWSLTNVVALVATTALWKKLNAAELAFEAELKNRGRPPPKAGTSTENPPPGGHEDGAAVITESEWIPSSLLVVRLTPRCGPTGRLWTAATRSRFPGASQAAAL